MIGENDKSMLERFKEWLGADFVLPKIKSTRKPKPLPKLPAKPKIEESDEIKECRKALDNGYPIYAGSHSQIGAKIALENTFYKCGRKKEDIVILDEGWKDGVYIIEAKDNYDSPEYTYFN